MLKKIMTSLFVLATLGLSSPLLACPCKAKCIKECKNKECKNACNKKHSEEAESKEGGVTAATNNVDAEAKN